MKAGGLTIKTIRWLPSCTCDAGRVVFDPFGGSGTVGICAEELGRGRCCADGSVHWYWGLRAYPEYCQMARERIDAQQPSLRC